MVKYRHFSYEEGVMLPVNFNDQIVEGTKARELPL